MFVCVKNKKMYCRKEMVKIFKCYLIPKKSCGTWSKGAIFFGQPCIYTYKITHTKTHAQLPF